MSVKITGAALLGEVENVDLIYLGLAFDPRSEYR
jgi:hypothetical protein